MLGDSFCCGPSSLFSVLFTFGAIGQAERWGPGARVSGFVGELPGEFWCLLKVSAGLGPNV